MEQHFYLSRAILQLPAGSQLDWSWSIQVTWHWKLLAAAFMWRHFRAWPKVEETTKHPGLIATFSNIFESGSCWGKGA